MPRWSLGLRFGKTTGEYVKSAARETIATSVRNFRGTAAVMSQLSLATNPCLTSTLKKEESSRDAA